MKLVSIPFGKGGLGRGDGANKAPLAIKKQLKDCYANEDGIVTPFEDVDVVINENNVAQSHTAIEQAIAKLDKKAIILGGDHSITYSTVKGFAEKNPDFWLVVFDAHPDLMEDFIPPTQESFLFALINKGIVKPEQCVLLGVRNWDVQEIKYLRQKNIMCYTMQDIYKRGIKDVIAEVMRALHKPVYVSLDIDVVDPVQAIGTGYIEHGGMSSRELIYSLQQLKQTGKLALVDIVEVNPDKDINDMTSKLAAKCVVELADF